MGFNTQAWSSESSDLDDLRATWKLNPPHYGFVGWENPRTGNKHVEHVFRLAIFDTGGYTYNWSYMILYMILDDMLFITIS